MALHGGLVYVVIGKYADGTPTDIDAGLVRVVKGSSKTATITRKGIGDYTKVKFSSYSFPVSFEGDVTSAALLNAILNSDQDKMYIKLHDIQYDNFVASSLELSASRDDPLTYSVEGEACDASSITAVTGTEPGTFFVMAEATLTVGGVSGEISEFSISSERSLTPIPNTSGSSLVERMKPSDFGTGPWTHTAKFNVVPDSSLAEALDGAWDPSGSQLSFTISFVDAYDDTHTLTISGSGGIWESTEVTVDAEKEVVIIKNMVLETLSFS